MASSTVSVGCKLPNGLNLGPMQPGEKDVVLAGANARGAVLGCGITHGVDAEFFKAWRETHKDVEFVKNGLIFAYDRADMVEGEAKNREKIKSGFERLDPEKPGPGLEKAKN